MTSPILDEGNLIGTLAVPCAIHTAEFTRTASMMAIVDCRDRKVTRDFYIQVATGAMGLNETLRRAEILAQVVIDLDKNEFSREKVISCIEQLMIKAETLRSKLKDRMDEVAECAYDTDTFH